MTDPRIDRLARILVDHSTQVQRGERVAIWATTAAEPLVRALYTQILQRGGQPHLLLDLPDQERLILDYGDEAQIDALPVFRNLALNEFEVYIKIRSETDLHQLNHVEASRQARREKALASLLATQMRRGATGELKWALTLFPTEAYAREAGMSLTEFENFVYRACHADGEAPDPVAYWREVERSQQAIIDRIQGHDQVTVRGPHVDLSLSVRGRTFMNAAGRCNMPDGEIYTGPVENSVNGWVHFTYPAQRQGRVVEGVRLRFEDGKVVEAAAEKNEAYLLAMLDIDAGARYLGEFAIGTNYQIDRFSGSILFDEKIGGTFHMALGAGYPETGSQNHSSIHWDMICDLRQDSEIAVDGEVIYRNGRFSD